MKKALLTFIICATILISGCYKQGVAVQRSQNGDFFEASKLCEVEGVKVYRIFDAGRPVYFTNTTGTTSWTEQQGKNNSVPVTVSNTRK